MKRICVLVKFQMTIYDMDERQFFGEADSIMNRRMNTGITGIIDSKIFDLYLQGGAKFELRDFSHALPVLIQQP